MRVYPVSLFAVLLAISSCLLWPPAASADYTRDSWVRSGTLISPDSAPPNVAVLIVASPLQEYGNASSDLTVSHTGNHSHEVETGMGVYRPKVGRFELLAKWDMVPGTLPPATQQNPHPSLHLVFGPETLGEPHDITSDDNGIGETTHVYVYYTIYYLDHYIFDHVEEEKDFQAWLIDIPNPPP